MTKYDEDLISLNVLVENLAMLMVRLELDYVTLDKNESEQVVVQYRFKLKETVQ